MAGYRIRVHPIFLTIFGKPGPIKFPFIGISGNFPRNFMFALFYKLYFTKIKGAKNYYLDKIDSIENGKTRFRP